MTFLATTVADVLRGSTTDVYGDEVPSGDAVHSGVPVSILERSRITRDPATGEARTMRYVVGRAVAGLDIRESDRVHDRRTGEVYAVLSLRTRGSIVGHADLEMELVRTTQDR